MATNAVLAAIVFLILLVASVGHELGHMAVLRFYNLSIYRLSVGFGPIIKRKRLRRSGVKELVVRAIPLGLGTAFDIDDPSFQKLGMWQRVLIFSSGPLVNFILAGIVALISGVENALRPSPDLDLDNITRAFVALNLLLGICSFFPFYRFDGGRIFDVFAKRFFVNRSREFVVNLRIITTLLVAFVIFYLYHFWIIF